MRTIIILHNETPMARCNVLENGLIECVAEIGGESFTQALTTKGVPDKDGTMRLPEHGDIFIETLFYFFRGPYWIATEI